MNGVSFTGVGRTRNEIPGDLTFSLELTRCSLDLKFCEKWTNFNFKEVCAKFVDKNVFFASTMSAIKPKLECPIKSGNYTLDRTLLDLTVLKMFPIEGRVRVMTGKLISFDKVNKTKKVVLCLNAEAKITTGTR